MTFAWEGQFDHFCDYYGNGDFAIMEKTEKLADDLVVSTMYSFIAPCIYEYRGDGT